MPCSAVIKMDYRNKSLSVEFLMANVELAKEIVSEYQKQKEINCSWFAPKKPFVITMPKLTDNYYKAKKALNQSNHANH